MQHIKGNIFDSNADVIVHQVNCRGKMGSGVALQVKERYPEVYAAYRQTCLDYYFDSTMLLGKAQMVPVNDKLSIVNLFAQANYGYDGKCYTDYDALRVALESVNRRCAGKTVAIPYLMGCHLGGGDWEIVSKMIEEILVDCNVILYEYNGG